MVLDEENEAVEWDGDMPRSLKHNIEKEYELLKFYPLECINLVLSDELIAVRGFRSISEIKRDQTESIEIKTSNPQDDYEGLAKIDEGGQGEIYKVRGREDNIIYAMKRIKNMVEDDLEMVIQEASLISYLSSDELIKCIAVYHFRKQVFIVLEFMELGSMTSIIENYHTSYTEQFVKYSLYKVVIDLKKMHDENVLHRDIKSDNILISPDGGVKITDMGFACVLSEQQEKRKTQKGTPHWIAPEIAKGIHYDKTVDIWSLGCFAHELATG